MNEDIDGPVRGTPGLWRHDGSKLVLRGPKQDFAQPFVAVLGGSETFGKHVGQPYPALLGDRIGMPVANLGVMHAGVSLFSKERWLLEIASRARLTVLQVMGAQNMSNRLYCVHPRRNDRFLTSSETLRVMYPEIDFTDFNFTGHLVSSLEAGRDERFAQVVEELQWAWVQRMRRVITAISGEVLLLWLSERRPEDAATATGAGEPMFVTRSMLDELAPYIAGVVEVVSERPDGAEREVPFACAPSDAPLHADAARVLAERIGGMVTGAEKSPRRLAEALPGDAGEPGQSFSMRSGTAVKRSATRP
jgi:hypothetical protein